MPNKFESEKLKHSKTAEDNFWQEYYSIIEKNDIDNNKKSNEKQNHQHSKQNFKKNKDSYDYQKSINESNIATIEKENSVKDLKYKNINQINHNEHHNDNPHQTKKNNILHRGTNTIKNYRFKHLLFTLLFLFSTIILLFYIFLYKTDTAEKLYHESSAALFQTNFGYSILIDAHDTKRVNRILEDYKKQSGVQILMQSFIRHNDTVIDIGASYGYYATYLSSLVGKSGLVYAFEGSKEVFHFLKDSVHLNQIGNLKLYNFIIHKNTGNFYINKNENDKSLQYRVTQNKDAIPTPQRQKIQTYSLDNIVKDINADKISLLHINSFGNEIDIILGAQKLLSQDEKIKIITTWNPIKERLTEYKKIIDSLINSGFRFWIIQENGHLIETLRPEKIITNNSNIRLLIARTLSLS